jgi:hypothetical protein
MLNGVGMSVSGVIEDGMAQMSAKFKEMGGQVYLDAEKVKESNRVLWSPPSSSCPGLTRASIRMRMVGRKLGFFTSERCPQRRSLPSDEPNFE